VNLSGCPSPGVSPEGGMEGGSTLSVRYTQNECEGAVGGTRAFDERLLFVLTPVGVKCADSGGPNPQGQGLIKPTPAAPQEIFTRRAYGRESLSMCGAHERRCQAKTSKMALASGNWKTASGPDRTPRSELRSCRMNGTDGHWGSGARYVCKLSRLRMVQDK